MGSDFGVNTILNWQNSSGQLTISSSLIDLDDAGYASDMTGCFTGLGACGELSCFLRCVLCVLVSSSLVSLRLGKGPLLSFVEAMLGAIATAMLNVEDD